MKIFFIWIFGILLYFIGADKDIHELSYISGIIIGWLVFGKKGLVAYLRKQNYD